MEGKKILETSQAVMTLFHEQGADINLHSNDGQTCLLKVMRWGFIDTAIHLADSGASFYIPDLDGKLPIEHAKESNHKMLIGYLEHAMKIHPFLSPLEMQCRFLTTF